MTHSSQTLTLPIVGAMRNLTNENLKSFHFLLYDYNKLKNVNLV